MMKFNYIFGLFLLLFTTTCFALEQNGKLWLGINTQKSFSEESPWLYLISSELRFIHKNYPWQTAYLEGGLGRKILFNTRIWFGYRWSGHEPYHQFYQENRLFQQFIWPIHPNESVGFVSRSRLEEIMRGNQSQIALQLRERISFEMKYRFVRRINPYFYDELFFRLNRTNYTSNSLLRENRLFLGINFHLSTTQFLEIGYINQYQSQTPLKQNQINHILSFIYNF